MFWCAIYSKCRNTEQFEILVRMVNKTWHFSEFSITSMNTDSSVSYSTSQCRRVLARSVLVCYISVEIQFPVRMVKSVLDAITLSCQSGLADIENTWIATDWGGKVSNLSAKLLPLRKPEVIIILQQVTMLCAFFMLIKATSIKMHPD